MKNILFIILFLMVCSTSIAYTYRVDTVAEFNALTLVSGDIVEFNSSNVFPLTAGLKSGVTYKSFGGGKATITRSQDASSESDWVEDGDSNIWELQNTIAYDVGNIIVNDITSMQKVATYEALDGNSKFYYNPTDDKLFVYSSVNPATLGTVILAIGGGNCFNIYIKNNVVIKDLIFKYAGNHAISSSGGSSYVTIDNCEFYWIGGNYHSGTNRGGNGIEFWEGNSYTTVKNCYFENIYDEAMSTQGGLVANVKQYQYFYNNITNKCHVGISMWNNPSGSSMSHIYVYNNTFLNSTSFAVDYRPDATASAIHLSPWATGVTYSDIYIKNNILYRSQDFLVSIADDYIGIDNLVFDNNIYFDDLSNVFVKWNNSDYTNGTDYAVFSDYQTATSQDANSLASNPLLDFENKPKYGSPAIDAGTTLATVTRDIRGVRRPQGSSTDIGAHEHVEGQLIY